jgi:hypothetical protein
VHFRGPVGGGSLELCEIRPSRSALKIAYLSVWREVFSTRSRSECSHEYDTEHPTWGFTESGMIACMPPLILCLILMYRMLPLFGDVDSDLSEQAKDLDRVIDHAY